MLTAHTTVYTEAQSQDGVAAAFTFTKEPGADRHQGTGTLS